MVIIIYIKIYTIIEVDMEKKIKLADLEKKKSSNEINRFC